MRAGEEPTAALAAERMIRDAARAGNRLISGSRVEVRVDDAALRAALLHALARMGARPIEHGPGPMLPDFAFTDDGVLMPERDAAPGARIAWAAAHMPATRVLAESLRDAGVLRGVRIAVSLVLEPKTAVLALALRETGAEVAVFAATNETDPEIARELAGLGVHVFAPKGAGADGTAAGPEPADAAGTGATSTDAASTDAANAAAALAFRPELLIDDGAHLIRLAHTDLPAALETLRAASEETTSGVRPLREMHAEGALRIPVVAVNDARTKTGFDNLIGTGQSCVFAIADALDRPEVLARGIAPGIAGAHWVVIGYGPVGVGVARFAAALGARVTVVEHDAVRALDAVHDGFEARSAADALPQADVVVSATGVWRTLDGQALASLRPGAAVAVAGGIDGELALDELAAAGWTHEPIDAAVAEWRPAIATVGERGLLVIADGGGVNYTAAEGNPIEVMDLSFATQLAALELLCTEQLEPGVHPLPPRAEQRVARAALEARGEGADPPATTARAGGAAQPWRVHRYRQR